MWIVEIRTKKLVTKKTETDIRRVSQPLDFPHLSFLSGCWWIEHYTSELCCDLQEAFYNLKNALFTTFKDKHLLKGITCFLKSVIEPFSISKVGRENSPLCGNLISSSELDCFNKWMLYGSICWKMAERIHVNSICVNCCFYCHQLISWYFVYSSLCSVTLMSTRIA